VITRSKKPEAKGKTEANSEEKALDRQAENPVKTITLTGTARKKQRN
jgi:hypothetical protein